MWHKLIEKVSRVKGWQLPWIGLDCPFDIVVYKERPAFLASGHGVDINWRLYTGPTMKASLVLASFVLAHGSFAASSCGWQLKPDDCICMNSADGSLRDDETAVCCRNMGLKTTNNVRDAPPASSPEKSTNRCPDMRSEAGDSPDVQGLLQVVE